jgi:outer membrane protein TolC
MTLRFSHPVPYRAVCVLAACLSSAGIACAQNAANSSGGASTGTLTLKQAVALAVQNSSDVKVARMEYNVAVGEANVDRASFRPNLYTGSGAAYTNGFPGTPGGGPPALFQLDYTQSIFNPEVKSQQHAAEERARSAKLEIDRVQNDVIARTANAYLELAEVRHSLELLGTEQASEDKIIQNTHDRVLANQELPIEETKDQLSLAQVHERLVKLEGREDTLAQQLRDLTGLSDTAPLDVEQQDQALSNVLAQESDNQIVSLAMQSSESLAEAEKDRLAKQDLLHGAHLSYLPTVDLVGQYSVLSKINNYDDYYKSFQRNNINAGVQITIPLFAAKTSANVALAKSQLAASEATLENKRQQVRADAKQQQQDLRELDAAREVANWALKYAQQNLDLAQTRLQQGQATLGDVEQAQLDESERFVEFLDADFADQKAQVGLLQSTGQLAKVFQ